MTRNLLIAGTDPIQLQDYCLQELAKHTKDKQAKLTDPAFILVPDALKADIEKRYLSNFDVNGLMLAEVLSFQRFAYRIFMMAGGLAGDFISPIGKSLLIQKIICQNPDRFKRFQRFAGKTGFSDELEKVLRDFKRFDLDEKDIRDLAEKAAPSLTKDKISDFAELFDLYQKEIEHLQLLDEDDNLNFLLDLLNNENNTDLAFLKNTQIWITGFADIRSFNQQELKIIQRLSTFAKKLTITVCTDINLKHNIRQEIFEPGQIAFEQIIAVIPNIETIALDNHTPIVQRALQEAILTGKIDFASVDKEIQAKNNFNHDSAKIRLITNENPRQEWAFVAGEIKRLIKEANYRQKEIGIAVVSEVNNQSLVKSIFREFGLNAYITDRLPIKNLPLYRYIEGFLQICNPNYQMEDLLLFLRSGLSLANYDEIDEFENICLEYGYRYPYQIENPKYLNKITNEEKRETFSEFVQSYLQNIFQAAKEIRSYRKASDKANYLLNWLADETFFSHLENKIEELRKLGEEDIALSLAAAWEITIQLLEESYTLFNVENISQAKFGEIILGSLAMQIPNTIPVGLDRIRIGSMQELMYYDCKILFIVGMSIDNFPPINTENSFFNSREVEWIEEISSKKLPDYKKNQILAGLVNAAALFSHPKDQIYLSTPYLDSDQWSGLYSLLTDLLKTNQEKIDSIEIEDLEAEQKINFLKAIQLLQIVPGDLYYPDQRWLTKKRSKRYVKTQKQDLFNYKKEYKPKQIIENAKAKSKEENNNLDKSTQEFLLPQSKTYWHKAISKLQNTEGEKEETLANISPFNPLILWNTERKESLYLNPKSYTPLIQDRKFLSASSLENYQSCPYQFFSQNILKLQERPIWEIDPRDRGTMIHAMMEIALREFETIMQSAADQTTKENRYQEWLAKIQDEKLYDHLYNTAIHSAKLSTYADPIVKSKDGQRLKRIIRSALIFDSHANLKGDFLPSYFEWKFPPHFQNKKHESEEEIFYQPLYLLENNDYYGEKISLEFNGIIDRIDQNALQQYRLIDYKTGNKTIELEKIFYGLDLQLGLYQKIWQVNHPEQKVDSIAYFVFDNPVARETNSIFPPKESFNERLEKQNLKKSIKADMEQINAIGEFSFQKAKESTKNIIMGEISPNPKGLNTSTLACRYCQFKEICGYDQRLIKERATLFEPLTEKGEILNLIQQIIEQEETETQTEGNI